MKFEIIFLGTSAGVPSPTRSMPCLGIKVNGELLLFDVGECCQRNMMKYKVGYGSVRNIFISHLHLDHFLGIFGLIETLRMTVDPEQLNIFAPAGFRNLLINDWEFLRIKRIKQGLLYKNKDVSVIAFKTKHTEKSYGFVIEEEDRIKFIKEKAEKLGVKGPLYSLIKEKGEIEVEGKKVSLGEISYKVKGRKIVYTSDTMYSENTIKFAKDADVLIHEATFSKELKEQAKETKHSTTEDAAKIAKKANVKCLILNHISARYKEEELRELEKEAKEIFEGKVLIAYDGMRIRL